MIRRLRVGRDEAVHAAHQDDRRHGKRHPSRQPADRLEQQQREEHEREVVDDVIDASAVDPGQDLLDPRAPREHPVGRVDDGREEHGAKCQPGAAVDDAPPRDEGENGPGRGVDMDEPCTKTALLG